jgi:hypothetical protein
MSHTARVAAILWAVVLGPFAKACRSARDWTILPAQEAMALREPCSRAFPEGMSAYWKPSRRDVEEAEQALPAAIQSALSRASREERAPLSASPRYYRQYVGFVRGGHRVLYLSAFEHEHFEDDYRRHWLRTCDAWLSAFGAVYDLEKREFDWFSFDGGLPLVPPPPPPKELQSRGGGERQMKRARGPASTR